jgi:glyoxylase-like metal-dependent hydrolase (beta-lactamase superfamily II)
MARGWTSPLHRTAAWRTWQTVHGPDWSLAALHTPGHLGGHLCLALGATLFSGDHVMGWSTTIVSPPDGDMAAYMASLDRLAGGSWTRFLPGHGESVDPGRAVAGLLAHRRARERRSWKRLTPDRPDPRPDRPDLPRHPGTSCPRPSATSWPISLIWRPETLSLPGHRCTRTPNSPCDDSGRFSRD